MEGEILVKLNRLGWPITQDQVDGILNPITEKDKEALKWVRHFFKLEDKHLYRDLLARYAKACDHMSGIGVGTVNNEIDDKLIQSIVSAKKCYSYNEVIACIQMCALFSEMFCQFLNIVNKEKLTPLLTENKHNATCKKIKKNNENFKDILDKLNQRDRIKHLKLAGVINDKEDKFLTYAHEARIKYYHKWTSSLDDADEIALQYLERISKLANNHLDLLDNKENIKKIKMYFKNS